jgi:2-amino-4-hydroxy-6-hydroxymethyldihydropteridine diphosphokinase
MTYIISIGTNIGNRQKNIDDAVASLNKVPNTRVVKMSSVYETQPVGYDNQDNFYNAVLVVDSSFNPNEMLGVCLGIEAGFGRIRQIKNGPRILDLDLIFAENNVVETPNLTLPHPRYNQRKFVLVPLLELYPNGNIFGFDFKQYISQIENQDIAKVSV